LVPREILMRVLIHDYAGHPFPIQLSRELAKRGHVVIHAFAGGLQTPRGVLQPVADDPIGFEIVEVPMSPDYLKDKYRFLRRRRHELAYGVLLAGLVDSIRPDIVISGNTPTEPQWALIAEARRRGVPVVTWLQDFYGLAVDKLARKKMPWLGAVAGWWYRHLDGKCLLASAKTVAITEDFVPLITAYGVPRERIHVIPNWAPIDEIPMRPTGGGWAEEHGLSEKFVFLYSGTLAMKHNPELLRRIAVRYRDEPRVGVVVVSEGPGADFLRACIEADRLDNLKVLPFQPHENMQEVLATADVLMAVLESDAGVFSVPSKVLTYHCAGRAILGSMPGQNLAARIVSQQGSGICVAPDDTEGFIRAAERLYADSALRQEMGRRARQYAEREFDIVKIAEEFELVIGQAMASPAD